MDLGKPGVTGSTEGGEDPRITAFWGRYGRVLRGARIPEKGQIWFRRACERFIAWMQPTRLVQTQCQDVIDYLKYLDSTRLERWRLEQASEALRFLLADTVGLDWAREWVAVTWSEDLPSSESIQRGLGMYWERGGRSEAFQRVREKFHAELERTVTALRVRHYAFRTEQTYLEWTYRFLLFCGTASAAEISGVDAGKGRNLSVFVNGALSEPRRLASASSPAQKGQ